MYILILSWTYPSRAKSAGVAASDLLALCDELRDGTLVDLGVRLEDRADGAVWRRDDPAAMREELAAKVRI